MKDIPETVSELLTGELKDCAESSAALDRRMERVKDMLEGIDSE